MRPVVCMITGGDAATSGDTVLERVAAAARAGVSLIQIRERALEGGPLFELVRRAVGTVAGTRTRIIVNDRLDVALGAGAHGVHLRGDSMPAGRARAVCPRGFLIGRSVHDAEQAHTAASAGGLDYLVFGAVFPSSSKPGRQPAGLDALARVVRATPLPVLAVGGVSAEGVSALASAGAAGFAAISMFTLTAPDRLAEVVREASAMFDAAKGTA